MEAGDEFTGFLEEGMGEEDARVGYEDEAAVDELGRGGSA